MRLISEMTNCRSPRKTRDVTPKPKDVKNSNEHETKIIPTYRRAPAVGHRMLNAARCRQRNRRKARIRFIDSIHPFSGTGPFAGAAVLMSRLVNFNVPVSTRSTRRAEHVPVRMLRVQKPDERRSDLRRWPGGSSADDRMSHEVCRESRSVDLTG
jgi:hypothetical protein